MKKEMIMVLGFLFCSSLSAQTALEKAAGRNDVRKIEALLDQGVDVNITDPESNWERTPLIAAAMYGKVEATELLLKRGADPDLYDAAGSTALIRVLKREGNAKIVEMLLKHGAKTEMALDDGTNRTPLIWAILGKHEAAVRLLLEHGANPAVVFKSPFGDEKASALEIAQKRGGANIVRMLEQALR